MNWGFRTDEDSIQYKHEAWSVEVVLKPTSSRLDHESREIELVSEDLKNVFPLEQAKQWSDDVGEYLDRNNYLDRAIEKAGLDNYFGACGNPATEHWGCHHTWIPVRTSAGLIRRFRESMSPYSPGTGSRCLPTQSVRFDPWRLHTSWAIR